jgi:hypothetical protein
MNENMGIAIVIRRIANAGLRRPLLARAVPRRTGVNDLIRAALAPLRGTFARSVAILTSAALLQNALVLATSPILSRLFSPEEFGVAGLVYAFAAVPTVAATGHYFLAIMQTRKRVESVNIIVLSWLIVFSVSFLASIIVTIIYYCPNIFGGFGDQLGCNIFFIPILMLLEAFRTVGRVWEVRHADYRSLFRNRLIETVGTIISQISAGLAGVGAIGLVGGRLLGIAASAFDLFYTFARDIGRSGRRSVRLGKLKQVAGRYGDFPSTRRLRTCWAAFADRYHPFFSRRTFRSEPWDCIGWPIAFSSGRRNSSAPI